MQSSQSQQSNNFNDTLNPAQCLPLSTDTPTSSNSRAKDDGADHDLMDARASIQKREEAKQALVDLHSHGLGFTQIVDHGMDPAMLRILYAESGIPVTAPQLQSPENFGSGNPSPVAEEQDRTKKIRPNTSSYHSPMPLYEDLDTSKNRSSPTKPSNNEKKVTTNSIATIASGKPVSNNFLAKMPGAKTSNVKPTDRKEYIARMLAAKAGKPAATPSVALQASSSVTTKLPVEPTTSIAATKPDVPTASPLALESAQQVGKDSLEVLPQSTKDDIGVGTKRKAQTDLARQKIEALKLQQETRRAISNDSANQKPALSESSIQIPTKASITVPRPPVLTRQSSFFSPVSQRAPFSIPGLFMTADSPQSVKPSKSEPNQPLSPQIGAVSAIARQSPSNPRTATALEPSIKATDGIASVSPMIENIVPRKRNKAADFLDSPSTKVKRPLGHQKDSSVIIEISDDELADASDAASMIIGNTDGADVVSKTSQPNGVGTKKQKLFQDAPPLSELPSRKRTPTGTPPVVPLPTQAKGLKTKEMEIQLMNRKIAELEQRVNAKRTFSRAHTPGLLGSITVTSSGNPQDTQDMSDSRMENPIEPGGGSSNGHLLENGAPSAMDGMNAMTAEKKLHEVEKAKAEAERSLASDAAKASDEERNELQVFVQNRQHTELHVHEKEQQPQAFSRDGDRLNQNSHPQEQNGIDFQTSKLSENHELRQTRRTAIESGLPVLEATMEKTRQKLESLKSEIEELEMELQKGIEGRRALLIELEDLARVAEAQQSQNKEKSPGLSQRMEQESEKRDDQGE